MTIRKINEQFEIWQAEDTKFATGNSAAGTRARKALGELAKLIKVRRNEISAEKAERAAAKAAAKSAQ